MVSKLILDFLVAGLLAATLFYCIRLERRLGAFRSGQDGLKEVVDQLNSATDSARASIEALKAAAGMAGEQLEKRVRGAEALIDEMKVIVEAGNNLANRLEARLTGPSRLAAVEPAQPAAAPQREPAVAPVPNTNAREERILRALREAR